MKKAANSTVSATDRIATESSKLSQDALQQLCPTDSLLARYTDFLSIHFRDPLFGEMWKATPSSQWQVQLYPRNVDTVRPVHCEK